MKKFTGTALAIGLGVIGLTGCGVTPAEAPTIEHTEVQEAPKTTEVPVEIEDEIKTPPVRDMDTVSGAICYVFDQFEVTEAWAVVYNTGIESGVSSESVSQQAADALRLTCPEYIPAFAEAYGE